VVRPDHRDEWDDAPFPDAPGVWGYLMNIHTTLGRGDTSPFLPRPIGGCLHARSSGKFAAPKAARITHTTSPHADVARTHTCGPPVSSLMLTDPDQRTLMGSSSDAPMAPALPRCSPHCGPRDEDTRLGAGPRAPDLPRARRLDSATSVALVSVRSPSTQVMVSRGSLGWEACPT
jgi:hypothetical protein